MTIHSCFVHLADHEYANSTRQPDGTWTTHDISGRPIDNMRGAAKEVFDANPDLEFLVVHVYEHGGWHLAFLRDMTIVETANDAATLSERAQAFYNRCREEKPEYKYLPEVWRK